MRRYSEFFHSSTPFFQVIQLVIIGFIAFSLLSIIIALILQPILGQGAEQLSFEAFSNAHPISFMVQHFVPLQVGFLFFPGWLYFRFLKEKAPEKSDTNYKNVVLCILLAFSVFLLLPLFNEMNRIFAETLGVYDRLVQEKQVSDQLINNLIQNDSSFLFGLFTIGIITGIAEEFAFRGFLFRHLIKNTNHVLLSITLSAFLFAVLHFNYLQIIPLFLFGMTLAIVYYISNHIWLPIALHSVNNILNVVWMRTDTFPSWMENIQPEITIPSTLLLMGLLYYFRKKLV